MEKKTNEEIMEILDEITDKIGDIYLSLSCAKIMRQPVEEVRREEPKKSNRLDISVRILLLVFAYASVGLMVLFGIIGVLKMLGIVK